MDATCYKPSIGCRPVAVHTCSKHLKTLAPFQLPSFLLKDLCSSHRKPQISQGSKAEPSYIFSLRSNVTRWSLEIQSQNNTLVPHISQGWYFFHELCSVPKTLQPKRYPSLLVCLLQSWMFSNYHSSLPLTSTCLGVDCFLPVMESILCSLVLILKKTGEHKTVHQERPSQFVCRSRYFLEDGKWP